MATLKLDLIRRGRAGYWRCLDAGDLLFCARGFASVFGRTRLSRCTLEVRAANPRRKGWVKLSITHWSDAVVVRYRNFQRALLCTTVDLARRAGLIPPGHGTCNVWARVTYHKAPRAKRSPR